jgi:hypothetical protein
MQTRNRAGRFVENDVRYNTVTETRSKRWNSSSWG